MPVIQIQYCLFVRKSIHITIFIHTKYISL